MREAASRQILTHVRDDFQAIAPIYHMYRGMMDKLMEEEAVLEKETGGHRDEWN